MPYKTKEEKAAYAREWRRKNKERLNRERREKRAEWNRKLFEGKFCILCHSVEDLVYHHRDPSTKLGTVTRMPKYLVEAEIAKCDCLCRACHTFIHKLKYTDREAYKQYRLDYMKKWHVEHGR